jgi:hypothetical protein
MRKANLSNAEIYITFIMYCSELEIFIKSVNSKQVVAGKHELYDEIYARLAQPKISGEQRT